MTRRGEFDLIADLFAPLAASNPGALGLLDDAALLGIPAGCEIVSTVDAMVEGVHFSTEDAADLVARKLLRVNLSDLAAMGATPLVYFLTLVRPETTSEAWLKRFTGGLASDQRDFCVHLSGGDTVSTAGPLVLSLTAIGSVASGKAIQRRGAAVGDILYVSGTIGDAALGLALIQGRDDFDFSALSQNGRNFLVSRLQLPDPRLALGQSLLDLASAAVDISDGLIADAGHISSRSKLGLALDLASLPMSEAALSVVGDDEAAILKLMTGGEDYELAFTASANRARDIRNLSRHLNIPLTAVGHVVDGDSVVVRGRDGREIPVPAQGFTHF